MPLTDLWQSSPDQLRDKHVHQIIAFAGDGRLRDGNVASNEFREFLAKIPSRILARYCEECLTMSFNESGYTLQDLVNQVGQRLGFDVTYGRYRGTTAHVGFDGLWRSPAGRSLVVEVKTTDAYRIDLDTLAGYRRALVLQSEIEETESSILIVVGRQDTGDLEAQIRGSRHAWDVRLLSVKALLQLVSVREDLEDPAILQRIHQILVPREFTRLDEIIDVLFSTAEDLKQDEPADDDIGEAEAVAQKKFTPVAFHQACVDRISAQLGFTLVKRSRASFYDPDSATRLVCAVSREHERSGQPAYWFAFHPHQQEFLSATPRAFIAFGCGSPEDLLLIPYEEFQPWLEGLNTTEREDRTYWHVPIVREAGAFTLIRRKGASNVDLTRFLLPRLAKGKQPQHHR